MIIKLTQWPTAGLLMCSLLTTKLSTAAQIDVYGTFHSLGITADIAAADDANANAQATLRYRTVPGGVFESGMALSRISPTRFVGSVFDATPGTEYEIHVEFVDDGPLNGETLAAFANTRDALVLPIAATSYVASPAGAGSECSMTSPCALAQAIALAMPGDEVVLRGGVYAIGELTMPRSGIDNAPIVLRAANRETPILDGADTTALSWTDVGGGVYRTTAPEPGIHLVTANGRRLLAYRSLSDLQSLFWGVAGSYTDGSMLWVHLDNDLDPAAAAVGVSRFNHAFLVERDHLWFIGLTFRHYGYDEFAQAIYIDGGSDNRISQCRFVMNDTGVSVKRAAHRNVIEDNQFSDDLFDWPWDAVKDASRGDPLTESGAVELFSPVTGKGNVIRRNVVHDVFDGIGACPQSTDGVTNETDVYDNVVFRVADDALTADGTCSNVRIWGNTLYTTLVGISMAPSQVGPTYALRNLIYNTGAGINDFPGTAFKFNSGFGQSGPMYVLHNTVDAVRPDTSAVEIKSPGSWRALIAVNNVWAATDYSLVNVNAGQPADFRSNAHYSSAPARLIRWDSVDYADLTGFQAATGQASGSVQVEPGFRDVSAADYHLGPDSALRDAGEVLPGVNSDFVGAAPDLGAFEAGDLESDMDLDGVDDPFDNCVNVANTLQRDTDADGYGNFCDADFNNDCVVNVIDLGVLRSVFFTTDEDADLNGDGVVNAIDLGLLRTRFFSPPGPGLGAC